MSNDAPNWIWRDVISIGTYLICEESIQHGMQLVTLNLKIVIEAKKCQAAMFGHVGFLVRTLGIAQSGKFWGFLGQITHEKGSSVDVEAHETKCCPTNSKNRQH